MEASGQNASDDVSIVLANGISAKAVIGDPANIKLTTQADFDQAESSGGSMDIRIGNGFDVHAFEEGDHVILNGIVIPHDKSLKGHSDADVAMHALTDAIYGALAMGDIGQHFPPSQAQWKGATSDTFLKHAVKLSLENKFNINHLDCTIICEHPKIGPHSDAMRENLADITGVDKSRISVKATTSEQLGFTGRGEGIAAQASATLVKI